MDVVANDTDLNGDALPITDVTAPVDDDGQTRGKATVVDGKVATPSLKASLVR